MSKIVKIHPEVIKTRQFRSFMSSYDLSSQISIDINEYYKWLRLKRMPLGLVKKICKVLNLTLKEVII